MAYTTIDDPSAYFQTKIYTGSNDDTAGPGQSLTFDGNSDLQPDMMIWSNRSSGYQRPLMDSSFGTGNQLWTDANETASDHALLTSFDSDGWTIPGSGTGSSGLNDLRYNYVGWAWKANGGTTTTLTRSGNVGSGSSPTIQTNSTSKFSIVRWRGVGGSTGTFGHGLGVKPEFIIIKKRGGTEWAVYHHKMNSSPEDYYMELSTRIVATDDAGIWNDTAPTTSTVTIGDDTQVADNSIYFHSWMWAGVQGYSKFGSYEGNGEGTNGPFVYLGFKPAWILIRNADTVDTAWYVYDNERKTYNPNGTIFFIDAAGAEGSDQSIDLLSNGFKVRPHAAHGSGVGSVSINGDGDTVIYAAFAENPFVTSGGIPATAS